MELEEAARGLRQSHPIVKRTIRAAFLASLAGLTPSSARADATTALDRLQPAPAGDAFVSVPAATVGDGVRPAAVGAIGVSAMMHGYLAFDAADELLVPFRTWRNTSTGAASAELTELLGYNIPLRWSVAHLHQAVLDAEPHVPDVRFVTTLAGYVHWRLTGRKVLGVGDASGMFPVDPSTHDYDADLVARFDAHVGDRLPGGLRDLFPQVLVAGQDAGALTPEGAALLDPTGTMQAGIPVP